MAKVELDIRAQVANLNKGLDKTQKELKQLQVQSNKTSKTMQSNMNQTSQVATKLQGTLTALFSIGAAVQLGKAMVNVTAEFEKYKAVLGNTLGSAQAANREFAKIQQFAAETPFSVRELTDSFVRLVNQGFKPTTVELRKLGDLAASTGKEFIQLTEAIIDAQTGEFERLKEFGIRASKEGDNVTFTFKEVETQVEFTASAIQGYILSLGELEGVSGAMLAISKTLGGQLNNLADSWDNLLNIMGTKSKGAFSTVISALGTVLNILSEYNELQQGVTESSKEFMASFVEANKALTEEEKISVAAEDLRHYNELFQQMNDNTTIFADLYTRKQRKTFESLGVTYNAIAKALSNYIAEQEELIANRKDEETVVKSIESLKKELKDLNDEKAKLSITDTRRLIEINLETEALKEQIEALNKLGTAAEAADKAKAAAKEKSGIEKQRQKDRIAQEKYFGFLEKAERDALRNAQKASEEVAKFAKENIDRRTEDEELMQQGIVEAANQGFNAISALNNAAMQKRLADEKLTEEEIAKIKKEFGKRDQAINIAQAIMNGAVGITKTGAELGYPLAIPFQIALALQTLGEIAVIRSQKFAQGGYEVLGGKRHAQGGVDIGIGEAEAGEGIAVFNRQTTQKYGKFLPAFVKAMNDNDATVTGYADQAYNISLDDSRQVTKLEAIRELLAQPEVRIQGKYKIITRNGHTQKVKI